MRRPPVDVRFHGEPRSLDRVAFVTLAPHLAAVRVRFRFDGGGTPWRCDACGRHRTPTCPHSAAVAHQLISDLLTELP